jgi:hypothetical protein
MNVLGKHGKSDIFGETILKKEKLLEGVLFACV